MREACDPIDGRVAVLVRNHRPIPPAAKESAVICCSTVPGRTKAKMMGVVVVAFRFEKLERRSLGCAACRVLRRIFLVAKSVQVGTFCWVFVCCAMIHLKIARGAYLKSNHAKTARCKCGV